MVSWTVEYQGADKKIRSTHVKVDEKYATALEVQAAIEKGEIADLMILPGAILMVKKTEAMTFHVSRG